MVRDRFRNPYFSIDEANRDLLLAGDIDPNHLMIDLRIDDNVKEVEKVSSE